MNLVATFTQAVMLFLPLSSYASAQEGGTCCNLQKNSKNLTALNFTIQENVQMSPLFKVIACVPDTDEEANQCYTFLKISDSRYLQFTTTTDIYGNVTVKTAIITDNNPNGTGGIYRVEGNYGYSGNESTIHDTCYFDVACSGCQPIYMGYRNFLLDSCQYVNYEYDIVYGLSSTAVAAPSCLDRFEELVAASGLRVAGCTLASGTPTCVASFNNVPVINANAIDPAYAISYPVD